MTEAQGVELIAQVAEASRRVGAVGLAQAELWRIGMCVVFLLGCLVALVVARGFVR